jgi:hypothetical protein
VVNEWELRRAAFGDRPDAQVWPAVHSDAARERWLAAVVLGAQGHYAAAATVLTALLRHPRPVLASLAGSTLASHRRQLGGHAAARRLDAFALGRLRDITHAESDVDSDGVDTAGAAVDALLGLAADAIGLGRIAEASRLHAAAEKASGGGWRSDVRLGWVAAEIELASGRAEQAVAPAEAALSVATAAGSARHVLKSELVLGTALVVWGAPESRERGVQMLRCDLNHTVQLGLASLVWPAALVVLEHDHAGADRALDRARNALNCVLRGSDPEGRRLALESPWVPTGLLRSGEPPNADPQANFLTD